MPFKDFRSVRGHNNHYAEKPAASAGIPKRTVFQHDNGAITYLNAFRRLAYKSQLVGRRDDHCRTKLLHSQEVSNIASQLATILGLDRILSETIALAHDVGSYPFAHIGEKVIKARVEKDGLWKSYLEHPERGVKSLSDECNLPASGNEQRFHELVATGCYETTGSGSSAYIITISQETVDGIKTHTPEDHRYSNPPGTLEAQLVRVADNFAYITQELEDADKLEIDVTKHAKLSELVCNKRSPCPPRKVSLGFTPESTYKLADLKKEAGEYGIDPVDLFSASTGQRLNAMIYWFTTYNEKEKNNLKKYSSKIDNRQIPLLEYPEGLSFCIDYIWEEIIKKEIHSNKTVRRNYQLAEQMVEIVYDNVLMLAHDKKYRDDVMLKRYKEIIEEMTHRRNPNDHQFKIATAIFISEFTDLFLERFFNRLWELFK